MQKATAEKTLFNLGLTKRPSSAPDPVPLRQELELSAERGADLDLILLSTADGRAIVEWSRNAVDPRRLAAMANSFLTLGETLAKEMGKSAADYATVSTPQGS